MVALRLPAAVADEPADDADVETAVFLPTDRLKERQLELARRLIKDARWSDAATLLDEILAADRDFFFKPDLKAGTWRSVKVEAGRLVEELPREGAEAYALQFRARADRQLQAAIIAGDMQAVLAVARRWFHTPAGHKATLLTALEALDAGQPLAAAAWLDRLATSAEWQPTVAIARAIAWMRAGDEAAAVAIVEAARGGGATARIGGRDVTISFPPGGAVEWLRQLAGQSPGGPRAADEWTMHRGEPARNAVVTASRPLLVPRFRVPLTRHPEEARWLEQRRQQAAEQEAPLLPAAVPLAVDGRLIVHAPMGLLAIDFATGKRLWLGTGGAAATGMSASVGAGDAAAERGHHLAPVFDDATSGTPSSDGRLVFAVESHPDALAARDVTMNRFQPFGGEPPTGGWTGGNGLVAYDLSAKGAVAWRLPATGAAAPATPPWYLGAPLTVSDQLFVLVEEAGEVRLDVLAARTGQTLWSQPLAELDEEVRADKADNRSRRVSGLSPTLAEGVLVCPTGAGAVIAVDLATRTLLWAYNYQAEPIDDVQVLPNGVRVLRGGPGWVVPGQGGVEGGGRGGSRRWLDNVPVVTRGRVLLTPGESAELHCLDLRSGAVKWKRSRKEGRMIAGAVEDRVIVIGRATVDALAIDDGRGLWSKDVGEAGATISGRAMLSGTRLFVPLDAPAVIEIDLATGGIVGRSPGRGGEMPGNLVAYRGEVVSQGVDSLDVFHQMTPLEAKIETAATGRGNAEQAAWATMWRGHLLLDRGDVAAGIASLREAAAAPLRVPPDMLAEAMVFAMERDPVVAASMWQDFLALQAPAAVTGRGLRAAIDGLVVSGDMSRAWKALRALADLPADAGNVGDDPPLVVDAEDRAVSISGDRWIRGRLATIMNTAPAEVRLSVDAYATDRAAALAQLPDEAGDAAVERFIDHFSDHPAARVAAWALIDRIDHRIRAGRTGSDTARSAVLRREFALLHLRARGTADDRERAAALLESERQALGCAAPADGGAAWPLGRVTIGRTGSGSASDDMGFRGPRVMPLPITADDNSLLPGLRLGFDLQQFGVLVSDGLGRRLGGPLALHDDDPTRAMGMGGMGHTAVSDAAIVGRVAIMRGAGLTIAYELAARNAGSARAAAHRKLWTHTADGAAGMMGLGRVLNRRFPRQGNIELGLQIREPEQRVEGVGVLGSSGLAAHAGGVPLFFNRTLQLRDPVSGRVLWERHRLDPDAMIFGDDAFICVAPRGGSRKMMVLSTADGRLVRTCDAIGADRLLLTHGRHVIEIDHGPNSPGGRADTVRLRAFDPVSDERTDLGQYSGFARAAPAGSAMLAVLEPQGRLTIIDLAARSVGFTTRLPEMPREIEQLHVMPWQDRYLVLVGRPVTEADSTALKSIGNVTTLPQLAAPGQPWTGSIWAIDRTSGDSLWQVPATILRHGLHLHQPSELPVLLFARLVNPSRPGDRPRLSLLCLDKRTGHAVLADDGLTMRQDQIFGCDIAADPAAHAITIAPVGGGTPDIALTFSGEPISPQPPFQAAERPAVSGDFAAEVEYWFNRVLTLPGPF